MLIIHVKHFLNKDGIKFFDQWFDGCLQFLSKKEGFLLLQRAFDDTNLGCVHIWLHFENREKLETWGNTEEHALLIAQLDPYRTQDWEATWYDTEQPRVERYVIPLGEHKSEKL